MLKIVGVTELQRRFRPFFDEVVRRRTHLVLTRGSRPEAVLIPYDDFVRYQQLEEGKVTAQFDQVWERLSELNADYSIEEIDADIRTARQA